MIIERFYDEKLAQASWLVGCAATGEALVIDPARDVEPYLAFAEREKLRITHVTETHVHADFVSGTRELAARTGARPYLSDEGGADWKYAFAEQDGAVLLKDGETFRVGNVRVRALHTPGHTPEHLSFEVTDTAAADAPMGVFTGDFVFVGDVGRPDLLERAAKQEGTMEAGARTLFRSLRRFVETVPDFAQLWPGHGAGSACGKSLGAVPQTTLGYEKLSNWGLQLDDEQAFVEAVLAGQPEPPRYFAEMKRINREGPPVLGGTPTPYRVEDERLREVVERGEMLIDTRPAAAFAAGHVPGSISIPLNRSFTTWAGWLIPYDRDFHLIVADGSEDAHRAALDLASIGLDRLAGWFGDTAVTAWRDAGGTLVEVPQMDPRELDAALDRGTAFVVDVRGRAEWEAGHLPDAPNIPVGYLSERLDELPRDRAVVTQCQTGGRSAIAASVLQAHGFEQVVNLAGGIEGWRAAGLPVERGVPA